MPTVLRFLKIIGILTGLCFGIIFIIANAISPEPREMSVSIPQSRLALEPIVTDNPAEKGDETSQGQ